MLRETLTALRDLGPLRLMLALALNVAAHIVPSYLSMAFSDLWLVAAAITSYFIARAVPTGQPLFSTEITLRPLGRYALANLWVYGLALLAMLPGLVLSASWLTSGNLHSKAIPVVLTLATLLPIICVLTLVGTALPAAAMGAPFGLRSALAETRGLRWPLFGALVVTFSPSVLIVALKLAMLAAPASLLTRLTVAGLSHLLSPLSLLLTATLLAVVWRRRHPPAPLAEVFA